ncbi:phage tail protein [Halpernia frigidisoli]|uniref:Microcystin-dependent protein n=1 Tax=Halpernia frigidisoli TaxID=1125876 RepID=A0A1I3H252_9FLAO|nr:tail fiber protein [Halpernia frigidisoli]SFI29928.1 Microcystin-dependent protein [Halpernia frigidisoli]
MKKTILLVVLGFMANGLKAQDQFLGQVNFVPYDFAPKGWAECNGQLMSINQNQALFSLLGTTYGGNGVQTFALPDMRGRTIIDDGTGISTYTEGQTGGSESVTLNVTQIPTHSHTVNAVTDVGNSEVATGNLPANTVSPDTEYSTSAANTTMKSTMLSETGGNQPHENRPPFIVLKCIIAITGYYPSRP